MTSRDTELMLDVGQANELKLALRRAGWTNADVKKFCEGATAGLALLLVRGQAKLEIVTHIVDTDADPIVPPGRHWVMETHNRRGQVRLERRDDRLILDGNVVTLRRMEGNNYNNGARDEFASGEEPLNANFLDYLLSRPELIPESWKGEGDDPSDRPNIYFWGTLYNEPGEGLFVRCLYWDGVRWQDDYSHWDNDWEPTDFAATMP